MRVEGCEGHHLTFLACAVGMAVVAITCIALAAIRLHRPGFLGWPLWQAKGTLVVHSLLLAGAVGLTIFTAYAWWKDGGRIEYDVGCAHRAQECLFC